MNIRREHFGMMPDGREVELFTLTNDHGMEIKVINYGGIITELNVPDRHGKMGDVVLGHDNLDGYLHRSRYFGALIGRYGNRIRRGQFTLNGVEYHLPINNGKNHLHGGMKGFDKVVWDAEEIPDGLRLTYRSWDGEEGYPGNLEAVATYQLTDGNELRIEYRAHTDQDTILDHQLTINADAFTPVDDTLIPTGELRPVRNTPMDFSSPTAIGAHVH